MKKIIIACILILLAGCSIKLQTPNEKDTLAQDTGAWFDCGCSK